MSENHMYWRHMSWHHRFVLYEYLMYHVNRSYHVSSNSSIPPILNITSGNVLNHSCIELELGLGFDNGCVPGMWQMCSKKFDGESILYKGVGAETILTSPVCEKPGTNRELGPWFSDYKACTEMNNSIQLLNKTGKAVLAYYSSNKPCLVSRQITWIFVWSNTTTELMSGMNMCTLYSWLKYRSTRARVPWNIQEIKIYKLGLCRAKLRTA